MTRTSVACDSCDREIPPTAPRYRIETIRTAIATSFDVCSPRCIAELAGRLAIGPTQTELPTALTGAP